MMETHMKGHERSSPPVAGEGVKLESVNDIRSKFDEDSTIHKVYEEEEEVMEINKVNFKVDNENIAGL
jgi:hypothetical protein